MPFLIMRLYYINLIKINYLSKFLVSDEILIEIFQANGFEDNIVRYYLKQKNLFCFGNWD
jgi:hypothetical protein